MNPFLWPVIIGVLWYIVYRVLTRGSESSSMENHGIAMVELRVKRAALAGRANLYVKTIDNGDHGRVYSLTDKGVSASARDLQLAADNLDELCKMIDDYIYEAILPLWSFRWSERSIVFDDTNELLEIKFRAEDFQVVLRTQVTSGNV